MFKSPASRITLSCVLTLIAACAARPALAQESLAVYLSPTGNDANPGTQDKPIQTLTHARDLIRKMNTNQTADLIVVLTAGTYQLDAPLELTAQDSGSNNHNIIYTAAPNATVIISGGVPVTGWKQIDKSKNLWSAPAPADLKNTRQLYINGVRAKRTRALLPVTLTQTDTGYTASSDALSKFKNPADIEFIYNGGNRLWSDAEEALGSWTEPRCPVAAIHGTQITMAQPCWNNSTNRAMLADPKLKRTANLVGPASFGKTPTSIENAYELLGTPGQFYFDRSASTFYYTPRPGEDLATAEVIAPKLEQLIHAAATADHPIHNIIFTNLQFSYATWLYPSSGEGFSEIQANYMVTGDDGAATQGLGKLAPNGKFPYGAWTKAPGNISIAYGQNIQFTSDSFVHLGAAGLELGDGSKNDLVQGCVFTDISCNGLELGGVDLPESKAPDHTSDNKILNNHLYNIACEFHGGVAICTGYAERTLIAHNQLDNLPYAGISMGWGGWPDKIEQAGQPNFSNHNVIANNLIFHHMTINADGGGIYTQGITGPDLANGERIEGNVIHDQYNSGHGVYTDNGCKNVSLENNVIFKTNYDNWGTGHKDYYDGNAGKVIDATNVIGNYWQQGEANSTTTLTIKNNTLITALDQAPAKILDNAGLEPAYKNILDKRFAKPTAPEAPYRLAAFNAGTTAYLSWSPSLSDGGSPIMYYTIHASTGESLQVSSDDLWKNGYATLQNLKPAPRSFTITATSGIGDGDGFSGGLSSTSVESQPTPVLEPSTKPVTKPDAPTGVKAFVTGTAVSIHLSAPASEGNSPITAYSLTLHPSDRKITYTGRSVITLAGKHTIFTTIDGLNPNTAYTVDVSAVSAAGESPAATAKFTTPSLPVQ